MKPSTPSPSTSSPQRDALDRSEEKAAARQPGSYKREETDEKIVEIPNVEKTERPIKGIDPK